MNRHKNIGSNKTSGGLRRVISAALAAAALSALLTGCGKASDPAPGEPEVIDVIPGATLAPVEAPTPAPTAVPTEEPTTLEGRILAGVVYPLFGGRVINAGTEGESVDINGDGSPETLDVRDIDGGPVFCIDGKPFMDIGVKLSLVSLDGSNMLFLSEKHNKEGYYLFYPDEGGNLYCRLFGIDRSGSSSSLVIRSSYEEYVKNGLEIMLHNPMIYTSVSGDTRTLSIDMNGDGQRESIVFDPAVLTVNGLENAPILSTTMPRFIYDAGHDSIVLSGSAGDYALSLRYDGSELHEDISYASLL